jgi:hypothetical protein
MGFEIVRSEDYLGALILVELGKTGNLAKTLALRW